MAHRWTRVAAWTLGALTLTLSSVGGQAFAAGHSARHGSNQLVTVDVNEEPDTLNPVLYTEAVSGDVLSNVNDGLLAYLPTNYPGNNQHFAWRPDLLASMPSIVVKGTPGPNALVTITYHLKPGIRWSDGAPVTSKDIWYTWQVIMNPANQAYQAGYNQITKIDLPNPLTAIVHMKGTYGPWQTMFGALLPYHVLGRVGTNIINDTAFNRHPVTTGPYMVKTWVAGQYVELVPNPYYQGNLAAGEKPKIHTIVIKFVKDQTTEADQLATHETQMVDEIQPNLNLIRQFQSIQGARVVQVPGMEYQQYTFNLKDPVVGNILVRKAFYYALDRQQIDRVVAAGQWRVAISDQPPLSWAFDPNLPVVKPNVGLALRYLEEAGYKMGSDGYFQRNGQDLTITIVTTAGNELRQEIMQLVTAQEARVGIKIVPEYLAPNDLFGKSGPLNSGTFQVAQFAWIDSADPDDSFLWNSKLGDPSQGGGDFGHYSNPQVDAWTYDALYAMDQNTRRSYYWKVQEQLAQDLPMIPLFYMPEVSAYNTALHGVVGNNFGDGLFNANYWNMQ